MASVVEVAKYFLLLNKRAYERVRKEDDKDYSFETQADIITHLKIQKLVYYAQGLHLAYFEKPLFDENIEAWKHGPVVKELYDSFKQYGRKDLMLVFNDIQESDLDLSDNEKYIIKMAFNEYGAYSAIGLRQKTHNEPTWLETYKPLKNIVIHKDKIKEFFIEQIRNKIDEIYRSC